MPVALNGKTVGSAAKPTVRTEADGSVVLDRGLVRERFTASADGIRQDFIINAAPEAISLRACPRPCPEECHCEQQRNDPGSVVLTLASGRRLAYSRLHVTDATGKELTARMEVPSAGGSELRIIVAAQDAQYPITIDPTITDEDWESMNRGSGDG